MLAQAPASPPAPRPSLQAMAGAPAETPRAIRRDVPMTNAIRRAFDAGTRDSTGRPGPNYWQLQTDYTINVRLDPATQTLTGTRDDHAAQQQPASAAADHAAARSQHLSRPACRAAPWTPAEITDGMVITQARGQWRSGRSVRRRPQTVAVARAAAAVRAERGSAASAERQRLDRRRWRDQSRRRRSRPSPTRRSRSTGVPKLPGGPGTRPSHDAAVRTITSSSRRSGFRASPMYDDLRGWDTNLYLGPSEFYNNFGRFDVRIDVPAGWIVSGTGVLQNPEQVLTPRRASGSRTCSSPTSITTIVGADEVGPGTGRRRRGDRLVWHFVADMVNDFAWATAKQVRVAGHARDDSRQGPGADPHGLPAGRAQRSTRTPDRSRATRSSSTRSSGSPYPFPQLTLQDGPSAGMEYPMVINSNQGAADHETGHQWWPMMVGNNETWYGWMDEGFNQYMNILSDADAARQPAEPRTAWASRYGRTSGNEDEPPMMWNANYGGPACYGFTTYSKTPLMLSMLGGIVGDDACSRR